MRYRAAPGMAIRKKDGVPPQQGLVPPSGRKLVREIERRAQCVSSSFESTPRMTPLMIGVAVILHYHDCPMVFPALNTSHDCLPAYRRVLRINDTHGEPVQVLQYVHGQAYGNHVDYHGTDNTEPDRAATQLWSLTGAPIGGGGETYFPRAGGLPKPNLMRSMTHPCIDMNTTGLGVRPTLGSVVIFYSLLPNGQTDPFSLHAGCPPL
jgi:hypothetical protein